MPPKKHINIHRSAIPNTGLESKSQMPDLVGIGLGDGANFIARVIVGVAMSGPVQQIRLKTM